MKFKRGRLFIIKCSYFKLFKFFYFFIAKYKDFLKQAFGCEVRFSFLINANMYNYLLLHSLFLLDFHGFLTIVFFWGTCICIYFTLLKLKLIYFCSWLLGVSLLNCSSVLSGSYG